MIRGDRGMKQKTLLQIVVALGIITTIQSSERKKITLTPPSSFRSPYYHTQRPTSFKFPSIRPNDAQIFIHRFFDDFYNVGSEIVSLDTMKIITITTPFYLIARRADKPLHAKFYDPSSHANRNQPPSWVNKLLFDAVPIIPALAYGLNGFFHEDSYARRTAQIFAAGFFWAWSSKILIKKLPVSSCLRPFNGNYPQKTVHGGNPSGHTSTAAFTATYLGLTRGPLWAIPLSIGAAATGTLGFISNRHYVSQVVAGAGLGAVIGFAAHRVLETLPEPSHLSTAFGLSLQDGVGLTLAYSF